MFRAREAKSGREVALKLLTYADERLQERFRREGELTAALSHPRIVRVYAGGVSEDGTPFLAYELIGGGRTLLDLLGEHDPGDALGRERLLSALEEVAEALGHAHRKGVVHRDLKPGNVLIDAEGVPRVADFGLAWAKGAASLTQSGALVGTPSHMAPEQLTGARERVGPATDVWAMGVILYRVLTGQPPFPAQTMVELAGLVLNDSPTAPRALVEDVPPALQAVCLRALAREPEERFADGWALAEALRAARLGGEAPASPSRGRARWLGLAAALALLAASGAAALTWPDRETALRAGLLAYERGELGPAQLAALVSRSAAAEAPLLGEGHLRLARAPELAAAERLLHARRARDLGEERVAGQAALLEGELLAAAGQHEEAAAALAWGRARATPSAELHLLEAALLLRLGRAEACEEACVRAAPGARGGQERTLLTLRGWAALRRGQLDLAASAAADLAELAPADAAELRALLRAAQGEDLLLALGAAADEHPYHAPLASRLARELLARGEAYSARAALEGLREATSGAEHFAREEPPLSVARGLLEGLVADPPRVAGWGAAPSEWQAAAATWWAGAARRELALRQRAASLAHWTPTNAPAAGAREARARRAAEAVLALPGAGAPARARAHLVLHELGVAAKLRGRACYA